MAVNGVTQLQAQSLLQGDQVLRAARGLERDAQSDASRVTVDRARRDKVLRARIDEMVGMTFYGTLLKTMRNSSLKGPYGHGGRGEEIFANQLDMVFAQELGKASRFDLSEAIFRRLTGAARTRSTQTQLEKQSEES